MISDMPEDAETKAKRRRRIRESLPLPLNEIPLRHVDSVQALNESQRGILAAVLQKQGVQCLVDCLFALKSSGESIESEDDLTGRLDLSPKTHRDIHAGISETPECTPEDKDYLASLLTRCYPDMPESSAAALVASDVMSAALSVVATTRHALEDAKSDFVIKALYTLFEERLDALRQIISSNPAFVRAIQRSRPDWNITT
jgi:hypothetical protein